MTRSILVPGLYLDGIGAQRGEGADKCRCQAGVGEQGYVEVDGRAAYDVAAGNLGRAEVAGDVDHQVDVVAVQDVERCGLAFLAGLVHAGGLHAVFLQEALCALGGVDAVVDILNTVDRGTEKHIMETLEVEEPELADEIRKKMFVFEDILLLDDRAIQRVLRDVDNNDLAIACKGSTEEVQNAIFSNMSKRLAEMIKEDMEFMGPVRMKDVEEAQQKIVNIIRKLEDSAEIVISRGGGDEIVV